MATQTMSQKRKAWCRLSANEHVDEGIQLFVKSMSLRVVRNSRISHSDI